MKLTSLILALVATLGSASAVSIGITGIANTTVGFATLGTSSTLVSGNVYFFSSATDLAPSSLVGILQAPDPVAFFASQLGADPGQFRVTAFTNGAFTSSGAAEVGAAGNNLNMLIVGSGNASIGAYQNIDAPALGTVVMNPSNMTEDLLGTSTLTAVGGINSGFQLVAVPEPSAALLGALGILGLIRRRR